VPIEVTTNRKHRVRDFILYIAISLAVIGAIFVVALSSVDRNLASKWAFFSVYTLCAFGFFIERSRSLWRKPFFWMFVSCSFLLHCGIIWVFLTRVQHVKSDWLGVSFLEAVLLFTVAKWLVPPTPKPH